MQHEFDNIYNETYNYVLRYVIAKCDNITNVEDIMQNIYVKFYLAIEKNRSYVNNSKGFLIKLAKNELFAYYSLKNKMKMVLSGSISDDKTSDFVENVRDEEVNIEEDFINRFNNDQIWSEIKKEDLLSQKIMALHYLEDMKLIEISQILSVPESTIKSKLYRANKRIKNKLKGDFYE